MQLSLNSSGAYTRVSVLFLLLIKNSLCDYMVFLGFVSQIITFIVAVAQSFILEQKLTTTFVQEAHVFTKSDVFDTFK